MLSRNIWSDDYPSLVDPYGVQIHASRDGRPLFGFALQFMFGLANTAANLWYIRLFALIGLLLLNDLVIKVLSNSRSNLRITVASVGAFSIASFQINVHWATAFLFCWVAYFALLGYTLIIKDSKSSKLAGILLLIASSLSYPILTFFIFPIVFLIMYELDNKLSSLRRNSIAATFGVTLSALIALTINIVTLRLRGLTFNDRVSFISLSDFPDQILWFLSRPFVLTFRGYSIDSPELVEVVAGLIFVNLIIIAGLMLRYKVVFQSLKTYVLMIFFTLISMAPLFFPDQQQIDVRYVTVGSWLISYMFISGAFLILGKIFFQRHQRNVALISLVFLFAFFLSINFRYFLVIQPIYDKTTSFMSYQVRSCSDQEILSGVYVHPRETQWPNNPFIGFFSQVTDLASDWVPLNAVRVEIQRSRELDEVDVSWAEEGGLGCKVDLNQFETEVK